MPEAASGRELPSGARLRREMFAIAAVLTVVVLGIFYLVVPPEWLEVPHVFLWMVPSILIAAGIAAVAAKHRLEQLREADTELAHLRELVAYREHERDLAQEELVNRLHAERNLAREKMQFEAQLAAYEKYAALAQLALGAAHEINNPLLGILQHLELEWKATADLEKREEIEQCIAGTKRISSTIRGLINYARPGPLQLTKVHIGRLVEDTLAFLRHQPLFRAIQLETHIAHDLPAITADSNQLSQILMNLLINASEAMPEQGGSITIAAHKINFTDTIEITVADTGNGIPADILPHVLEPFFTTKRGHGTGLGLSISQSYIRSHGGDIRVDSIPSRGTTVRIVLPIRQEQKLRIRPEPAQDEVVV